MGIVHGFRTVVIIAVLAALLAPPELSGAQSAPELRFLLSFGAVTGPEDKPKLVAVQNETVLRSGDRLKLFIEPKTGMSVYFFHLAANGELTVIHPAGSRGAALAPGAPVFVPEAASWLQLDQQTGTEKFHLLASAHRLDQLESLLARHATLVEKPALQSSTEAILNEVKQLRQKNRSLAAPAEKPVRIGGSLRGPEGTGVLPDITRLAVDITAAGGFYSRTFTIDHR
ncbi:MAG: DUF4384 domain-containing protein [Desulfobacterales bacterium]|jgi:hypothetical protein|nr:DUF4384 domain-containing protein [Desulfobacterales bacterium]